MFIIQANCNNVGNFCQWSVLTNFIAKSIKQYLHNHQERGEVCMDEPVHDEEPGERKYWQEQEIILATQKANTQ